MPYYRDTDHLYEVVGAMIKRALQDKSLVARLREANLVIRFQYYEPPGKVTLDLTREPPTIEFGESSLVPHVEMSLSGDTAHRFWSGRLNVTAALALRQIVARGAVSKALKLLPAVKPLFTLYPKVLEEIGYPEMILKDKPKGRSISQALRKIRGLISPEKRWSPDAEDLEAYKVPIPIGEPHREDKTETGERPVLPKDEAALKKEMLRRMILIRQFEEKLAGLFASGELPTTVVHLSTGQEASAVGICFALGPDDYFTTTHRGHGHMLAKGASADRMMAEILGKETGLCKGRGGSMHVTDAQIGALGANGIVGASALIGVGAALSSAYQKKNLVAASFLGDGATNQGMFHEAANLAAVWNLPIVFVIENNQYGEFTPISQHMKISRLTDRAVAYGMPSRSVDGNDVWAVYQAARESVERARKGQGPTFVECLTYRWRGHMEGEEAQYRSPEEIEAWRKRCPIAFWKRTLVKQGIITESEASAMEEEVKQTIEKAMVRSKESPVPRIEKLLDFVYAPEPPELYRPTPLPPAVREISYSQAINEALTEEMRRDPKVFLMGEDVTTGGYFAVTRGLVEEFGTDRVRDTPISESAIVGSAVGAAMTGLHPVAEILFSDFLTTCADQLVNQAAKLRFMSGGQYEIPLVVRTPGGGGLGMAAQHSQSLESLFFNIPGLIILAPASPLDAKGLLKSAIRSHNPVLFYEHKLLYISTGQVPEGEYLTPIGQARIRREGKDVTIVAILYMVPQALEAAEELAGEGIEAEVIDPRTLVPLDTEAIVDSVSRTGRLVIVEEGHLTGGIGAEVAARVAELAFRFLKAPIRRVAARHVPVPYQTGLENAMKPSAAEIRDAVRKLFR